MFPYLGSQWVPENTKPGTRPEKQQKSFYLDKNIRNWDKTLQYLPIVFIDTPFLPYVGYPMWGNTHFSMFSFFGSEKNENRKRETPKKIKAIPRANIN